MGYTNELNLETPSEGQADWDTALNSNFSILDVGLTFRATAGAAVGSGCCVTVNNSGYAVTYDPRSTALRGPAGFSRSSVASGASGLFLHVGIVRSMGVSSLVPGLEVFASNNSASLGVLTQSYSAAEHPIGVALDFSAVMIRAKQMKVCPEVVTQTVSGNAYVGASSAYNFSVDVGNRGFIRTLIVGANSLSAYNHKVKLWSGSTRANSELLYETYTQSWSPSSADVTSSYFLDGAGFPYRNTDTASPGLIFGSIIVQSGHGATSGSFSVTLTAERTR